MDGYSILEPNVSNYFLLLFQMQEKLQQLQSQLIGHEAAKKDLEKSLADKIDSESEEKQKLMQVVIKIQFLGPHGSHHPRKTKSIFDYKTFVGLQNEYPPFLLFLFSGDRVFERGQIRTWLASGQNEPTGDCRARGSSTRTENCRFAQGTTCQGKNRNLSQTY